MAVIRVGHQSVPLSWVLAALLIFVLLHLHSSGALAQTDCEGRTCDVTDECPGPACPNPDNGDSGTDGDGGNDDVPIDLGFGCTVTETPEGGNGATCAYYCHDDRITFIYLEDEGIWIVDEANSVITGDNDFSSLNGVPICDWTIAGEAPCTTISIGPNGEITCGGEFGVTASATVPCMNVLRDPYPRGLVSVPNVFWITGPWSSTGSANSKEWCSPTIRNYTLKVGWQFVPSIPPTWVFDDRAWSNESEYASGMAVAHAYQTSSWGLTENGPSLDGGLNLPAYQVKVGTAWQAVVRRMWEELQRGDRKSFDCQPGDTECQELDAICREGGTDPENDQCYEWIWVPFDTGWVPVDLTLYGYPQPYYLSWAAGDVTMPPPGVAAVPLGQRLCNVPVPIIEAQSLLNSPANTP
jgi:hypothetical protein